MHLAAEAADLLADRWTQRRVELAELRTQLQRIAAALGRIAAGA